MRYKINFVISNQKIAGKISKFDLNVPNLGSQFWPIGHFDQFEMTSNDFLGSIFQAPKGLSNRWLIILRTVDQLSVFQLILSTLNSEIQKMTPLGQMIFFADLAGYNMFIVIKQANRFI